ncbi:MAG: NAD(P)H-binding protein [Polyangiaceae bacterium]
MSNVILTGATGMVGTLVLQRCLASDAVAKVTTLGRRATGMEHPKLREVVHEDFLDLSACADAMEDQDIALFCLGAYTGSVSDAVFKRITTDYLVSFAHALHEHSPGAVFCFLSGSGADPSERSRMAFARYKGAAENALLATGFPRVHIFRPGYIYPVTKRSEPNFSYRLTRALYPMLRALGPKYSITSTQLADALVHAALHGTGNHSDPVLENRDIIALLDS